MSYRATVDDLVSLRRDLYHYPEPAWCEFYTTARLVDELETRDLNALCVGSEILDADERMAVPDDAEFNAWTERAHEAGTREGVLDRLTGDYTDVVAAVERGKGPTVGLRIGADALLIPESEADDHFPAAEGSRSENEDFMHARGHDAHATVGLGVLGAIIDPDLKGTFKLFFQPNEEQVAGGRTVAKGGHLDDVDYLLALHVGLNHSTGRIICGIDDFLAVSHFRAEFIGTSAHTGVKPEEGRNANLGAAAATQSFYSISWHLDDATRINIGLMGGGATANIVAEEAFIEGEIHGTMMELMKYMEDRAHTIVESSAMMHDCEVEINVEGKAPSARSDDAFAAIIGGVNEGAKGVTSILDRDNLGGNENTTHLMQHVQDCGGLVAYVGVGTDHPGGHHIRTSDVNEETVHVAVGVFTEGVDRIATERP